MKGFRDTTKMMHGHHFARGGHSLQARFPHQRPAPGLPGGPSRINGLTDHGNPNSGGQEGHAAVQREVPSTQELTEHGGKGPLNPGYKKGGGAKHFHVHKHYYKGGKVKTVSKSYLKKMEMQSEVEAGGKTRNGGFPGGTTGNTRNKLAKGGGTGGTRNRLATGGTRDPVKKGGGMHINPAHRGKFTKKMTGSKHGHLTGSDVQRGLHSKSGETRKEANFARMARRGFKPLAEGGHIHDDTHEIAPDYSAGGALYARGGRR